MFPFLIPLLAGAAIGAVTSKDKLKGALLGAGLGATGGAAFGGLLGTGAAGAGATGLGQGAATVAGDAFMPGMLGVGGSEVAMGSAIPGLTPAGYTAQGLIGAATGKDAMYALGKSANAVQQSGLLGQDNPAPIPQLAPTASGGAQIMQALASQNSQEQASQAEAEAKRRARRFQIIGG